MEDRGAHADQRRGEQQHRIGPGLRQHQQADEGEAHADDQRERLRPAVGEGPDQGLEQRGGALEGQRQKPDLAEIQMEAALEDRVDRRQQRLHQVVQQVGDADGRQDRNRDALC